MKTLILDFAGVIADINYKKMILDLPLEQKFSALRIFLAWKKIPQIKVSFNLYQQGVITLEDFQETVGKFYPNSAYVIETLSKKFGNYVKVNQNILHLVYILRNYGIKTYIMSNTIPETEKVISQMDLSVFEDVIMSTHVQMKKPYPNIFEFFLNEYDVDPNETLMIDDTEKNLATARQFRMHTKKCKNSHQTCEFLLEWLHTLEKRHGTQV